VLHRARIARVDRELLLADRGLVGDREAGARRLVAPPVPTWRVDADALAGLEGCAGRKLSPVPVE
jgi:hypothetical protein